jgi:hypothetical protein
MVNRLKLTLEQAEYSALVKAALAELRNPADQARYIVRQELQRRGLLAVEPVELSLESEEQRNYASTT